MRTTSIITRLSQVKLTLAIFCFIYAVFICGFSYGLSITEQMLMYEAVVLRPNISFSGGTKLDYSDLLARFYLIAGSFLFFILITRTNKKLLFDILALLLILVAIYQLGFSAKPGYLPGQTLSEDANYLQLIIWSDLIFFCFGMVVIILQIVTIWQVRRSNKTGH